MNPQRTRQRRRRVAALDQTQNSDESTSSESTTTQVRRKKASGNVPDTDQRADAPRRAYDAGARRRCRFKAIDLIPKRIWSFLAAVAFLLAIVAGLNLLHLNSPDWQTVIGDEGLAVLSLDSGRGLGVWYSNFLLLMTACVSLQLFLLQQHRRDDYHGSYRLWVWLAFTFLLASVASVTGISAMLQNIFQSLSGWSSTGSGLLYLFFAKLIGLTVLVVRGLLEVRHSKFAVLGLLTVFLTYGTAILLNDIPGVQTQSNEYIHSALGNCLLVGSTALFITILSFARYVYLDVYGLTGVRIRSTSEASLARQQRRAERQAVKLEAKQLRLQEKEEQRQLRAMEKEEKAKAKATAKEAKQKQKATQTQEPVSDTVEPQTQSQKRQKQTKSQNNQTTQPVAQTKTKKSTTVAKKPKAENTLKARTTRTAKTTPKQNQATANQPTQKQSQPAKRTSQQQQVVGTSQTTKTVARPQTRPFVAKSSGDSTNLSGDDYLLSLSEEDANQLSKSERRRLRKLKRRGDRRAA